MTSLSPLSLPARCAIRAFRCGLLVVLTLASVAGARADDSSNLASLDLEELMQIEVTSVSKQARSVMRSPAAITVLTQEDIRRSGVLSVPELLRGVPGLHVAQIDATHWSVSSRGFSDEFSNKLLVMIDGRTIYAPIFSGVLWNEHDLMLEDIERIEVVRGPGGTLWGANAVNGVIHIITRSAADTQGLLVSARSGSYQTFDGAARYGLALGERAHLRAYGKFADRDEFETAGAGGAGDDSQSFRTGARLDWEPTASDHVTLQGDFYDVNANRVLSAGPTDREDNLGGNVLLRARHTMAEHGELSFQTFWDRTERRWDIVSEERDTFDVELQHAFQPLPRSELIWGAGYRVTSDETRGSPGLAFNPSSTTDQVYNVFGQVEITLLEELLSVTLGTKLEHNDYTGLEVQPSGRLLLTPSERYTFWAAVSRAVRSPSRVEDDVVFTQQTGPLAIQTAVGDSKVDSEDLLAWEAGFRARPHEAFNLDVAAFYNDYDFLRTAEVRAVLPNTPFPPLTTTLVGLDNEMDGSSHGVEVSAVLQATEDWQLQGGYAFLRMDLDTKSGSTDLAAEQIENRSPRHTLSLRSLLSLPYDTELDTTLYWVDRLRGEGIGDYTRVDVRLAWHPLPNLELSVVGLNLAEEHREFADGLVTRASRVPRSVYAGVRWSFE
jgi:iron complex outermembrane receptor protein